MRKGTKISSGTRKQILAGQSYPGTNYPQMDRKRTDGRKYILEYYIISISSNLETHLNHTDRHTDGRVLLLVQLSRHTGQACKNI